MTRGVIALTEDEIRQIGFAVMEAMETVEDRFGTERSVAAMIHVSGFLAARIGLGTETLAAITTCWELFKMGHDYGVQTLTTEPPSNAN